MNLPFIQAKNYTKGPNPLRPIRLIVIHTMENQEKPGTALGVAKWFAGPSAPKASAHLCCDAAQVVECVKPGDIAWTAPGANRDGYHVELAGRAAQSTDDWHDLYTWGMLRQVAHTLAPLCKAWDIPAYKLSVEQVQDGVTEGFCGHVDVAHAFHKSTHTDPGPNFPWAEFLTMVATEIEALQ